MQWTQTSVVYTRANGGRWQRGRVMLRSARLPQQPVIPLRAHRHTPLGLEILPVLVRLQPYPLLLGLVCVVHRHGTVMEVGQVQTIPPDPGLVESKVVVPVLAVRHLKP